MFCTSLWIAACNDHATKKGPLDAILDHMPYKPLTDSIASAKEDQTAGLHFRRAQLLSQNNQHELAADDYRQAWEAAPDENTGLRYASTLSIIGQPDRAIRLLKACQQKWPSDLEFPGMLAELYNQLGRYKEALDIYDTITRVDSNNFDAWYEKGLLYEKLPDTAAAIQALEKAYRLAPVNTYGLELAHLYAETKNATALAICDKALQKDSTHELLDPFFIKGIYYANMTQYKKAITQFDSCIRRDWKFTDAYLEKGIAFYEQKQYDSARSIFQMTIHVSNTYPDGYYWMGRCYEVAGNKDEAVIYYRQALALDKNFKEAEDRIKSLR